MKTVVLALLLFLPGCAHAHEHVRVLWGDGETVALDGSWAFALDPGNVGIEKAWFFSPETWSGWEGISVPSTWEAAGFSGYDGVAWYARNLIVEGRPKSGRVGLRLTGVEGKATVWVNGAKVLEETSDASFRVDMTEALEASDTVAVAIRVEDESLHGGLSGPVVLEGFEEEPEKTVAPATDLVTVANEVAMEVEALRGWNFKEIVHKEVYTEAELREFVERKLFEEEYPGDTLVYLESFLHTVGLVPRDTPLQETIVNVLLNQIGGFYDPATKAFYMIEREGVEFGPLMDRVLIAHELTHALDDQHLDLQKLVESRERTEDMEFAIGSVIEGSATSLMTRYLTRMQLEGELSMNDLLSVMESEKERGEVFFDAPPYFRTLLARYNLGMLFLLQGELTAIMSPDAGKIEAENVRKTVENPPASSEQILHPERYWKEPDAPVIVDDASARALLHDSGYNLVYTNTAGEIGAAIVAAPSDRRFDLATATTARGWTNEAAMGWGGDRFYLLEPVLPDKPSEVRFRGVWFTMWDQPSDRDEFVGAYEATLPDPERSRFLLGEKTAVFLYAFDDKDRKKVENVFKIQAPKFTKGGAPWK